MGTIISIFADAVVAWTGLAPQNGPAPVRIIIRMKLVVSLPFTSTIRIAA